MVERFLANGSVGNLRKGRCGRRKTKRTPENAEKAQRGVIDPFWFEDRAGTTVSVNAQRYRQVISKFWTQLRRKMGGAAEQLDRQWL